MSASLRVAVLGADSLVGEALLELLVEERFPAVEIRAFAFDAAAGTQVSAGGEDWDLEELRNADLNGFELLFAAPRCGLDLPALRALAAKALVIDCGEAAADEASLPLGLAEDFAGDRRGLVAMPCALASMLAAALAPLHDAAGLRGVQVTACLAVSDLGRDAVEELAQQTRQLLTFQPVSNRRFDRQIAFNCLPQTGESDADGQSLDERRTAAQLRRLLALPELPLSVAALQVPVFYGHGAWVGVETDRPLALADLEARFAGTTGLRLVPSRTAPYYPTAVTEASGDDAVWVGRLRMDPSRPQGLQFWVVADNLRRCLALNAVRLARRLADRPG